VDRHIHSNQSVPQSDRSPEDLALGDEGTHYLRRLKRTVDQEGAAEDPAKRPHGEAVATFRQPQVRSMGKNDGSAREFAVRVVSNFGSMEPACALGGTLTDISLYGCYVEMNSTDPTDKKRVSY
jgi:hypothetical protein